MLKLPFFDLSLSQKCLLLLEDKKLNGQIIKQYYFQRESFLDIFHRLCNEKNIDEVDIINFIIKLFYVYIYPYKIKETLTLEKISLLFEQFIFRRQGCKVLSNKQKLRKKLLSLSFSLAMIADICKTAHIAKDILLCSLTHTSQFLGIDIGSGSGILLLLQYILAKRNKFDQIYLYGIERNKNVLNKTKNFLEHLNIKVYLLNKDAKQKDIYQLFKNKKISFLCNETLPGMGVRLWKEDFIIINKVLFQELNKELDNTKFFPKKVLVIDKRKTTQLILEPKNQFLSNTSLPLNLFYTYAIYLENNFVPLKKIGLDFKKYLNPGWEPYLNLRW